MTSHWTLRGSSIDPFRIESEKGNRVPSDRSQRFTGYRLFIKLKILYTKINQIPPPQKWPVTEIELSNE